MCQPDCLPTDLGSHGGPVKNHPLMPNLVGSALCGSETAATLHALFTRFKDRFGEPAARWAKKRLSERTSQETIFYPFGGPDLLFPLCLFPRARDYVLVGAADRTERLAQLDRAKAFASIAPDD